MTKKQKIILIGLVLIVLFVLFLPKILHNSQNAQVCFRENCFYAELAMTDAQRTKGLMYIEHLDENKGMLFIFDEENIYPFWMKNTLIPLDMIWISKNNEVVFIEKNALPCQENICYNIEPNRPAIYMLEINAGMVDKMGISLGDLIILKNI
ncbi:MAG: DUF192 domain-containing protein [Patescibacteria group bacterium]